MIVVLVELFALGVLTISVISFPRTSIAMWARSKRRRHRGGSWRGIPLMMAIWGSVAPAVDRLLAAVLRVGRGRSGSAFELQTSTPKVDRIELMTAGEMPLRGAISGRSVYRETRQPFEN